MYYSSNGWPLKLYTRHHAGRLAAIGKIGTRATQKQRLLVALPNHKRIEERGEATAYQGVTHGKRTTDLRISRTNYNSALHLDFLQ